MSKRRLHLILAMHRTSWGRTVMAIKIGDDLRRNGYDIHFVIHRAASVLFESSGLEVDVVDDHLGGLLQLYVDHIIEATNPCSIILCDFFSNANYLLRRGIHPSFLWDHGIPVIALDTWDFSKTGSTIDVGRGKSEELALNGRSDVMDLFGRLHGRLVPAPLSPCNRNSTVFNCLPDVTPASKQQLEVSRNKIRASGRQKHILFCTAKWQQANYRDPDSARLADALPRLLVRYVKSLGSDVQLIHVGPSRLEMLGELEGRYRWIGQMASNEFDLLLASVDLLLSANISATVLSKAFLVGTPSIVIQNSVDAATVDDVVHQINFLMPDIESWLKATLPLFPFRLWPLGYYRFLEPLLRNNPFCDACPTVELLDEKNFTRVCGDLLFNEDSRQSHIDCQQEYVTEVRALPSAARLIDAIMC